MGIAKRMEALVEQKRVGRRKADRVLDAIFGKWAEGIPQVPHQWVQQSPTIGADKPWIQTAEGQRWLAKKQAKKSRQRKLKAMQEASRLGLDYDCKTCLAHIGHHCSWHLSHGCTDYLKVGEG